MEFRQVEAFLAAASVRNFTRAASQLHRSQSAISQQIRLLEEEIGSPLFLRTSRKVRLSPIGRELLPIAQEILRFRSSLLEKGKSRPHEMAGRLTVGTSAAATAYLWAKTYREFAEAHPRIDMDIRTMQRTQDTIDHLLAGDLDLGFTPLPIARPGLESVPLGRQEAVLVVPAQHPLRSAGRAKAIHLTDERFILYEPRISFRWLSDEFFRREGITPKVILESNDTHLIKAMVEVGFGVAFLPNWSLEREVRGSRLQVVPIAGTPLVQGIGLTFRKRGVSTAARAFIDFCKTHRHLLPKVAQGTADGRT